MRFSVDTSELAQLEASLARLSRRAIPYAARNTLNAAAFEGRREWVDQIEKTFTLRNKWTTRSLRVVKARGTSMRGMQATLGSVAPYMATQEEGGVLRRTGKHGVAIPTSVASGEGRGARPRRRMVRRPNRLPSIQLGARGLSSMSKRQRNAVAISLAQRAGRKFVFLELERRKGIFRLSGGKRRPRLDLVWDLSRPAVRIPQSGTLERALRSILPTLPRIQERALVDQIDFVMKMRAGRR